MIGSFGTRILLAACALAVVGSGAAAQDELDVLPENIGKMKAGRMTHDYLLAKSLEELARRKARFRKLVAEGSKEDLTAYQTRMREAYLKSIGGFEGFPKLPAQLNVKVTGTVEKKGYKVEKILFEPQPKHYATALFFLPTADRYRGKRLPGVLIVSGHSRQAKGYELYQQGAVLCALNGMAVLSVDPIDQGERLQYKNLWGTSAHIAMGMGSILVGRNTATYEIWDNMRAIDYLVSRPEVDPERIGVMGNSGGGTQTAELLPVDARVKCAAPASYICSLEKLLTTRQGPGDSEQHFFGEVAYGKDHVEYLTMRAPIPVLVCANQKDFFSIAGTRDTFAQAKAFFARLKAEECIDIVETGEKHGWHQPLREASVSWMARWLRGEKRKTPQPKDLEVMKPEEYLVTKTGFVADLPGHVSTYALNAAYDRDVLAAKRKQLWAGDLQTALAKVRELAAVRPLAALPAPGLEERGTLSREGYEITKVVLKPEEGLLLPGLLYRSTKVKVKSATLYVNAKGKAADPARLEKLAREGRVVLAVDPRGIGETAPARNTYSRQDFAQPYKEIYMAYMLGLSYAGMRAEDILIAARWLVEREKKNGVERVDLVAVGNDVGIPGLHAAALERKLFGGVAVEDVMDSWTGALGEPQKGLGVNVVQAALTAYDLADLRGVVK